MFVEVTDDMVTEVSKVMKVVFKVGNDPVALKIRRLMEGISNKVAEVDAVVDALDAYNKTLSFRKRYKTPSETATWRSSTT